MGICNHFGTYVIHEDLIQFKDIVNSTNFSYVIFLTQNVSISSNHILFWMLLSPEKLLLQSHNYGECLAPVLAFYVKRNEDS